ncbi:MAG: integrin alpha [bacterium]
MNANTLFRSVTFLALALAAGCSDDSTSATQRAAITSTSHIEIGVAAAPFRGFDVVDRKMTATLLGLGRDVEIDMDGKVTLRPSVGAASTDWSYSMSAAKVGRGNELRADVVRGARVDGSVVRLVGGSTDAIMTHEIEGLKREWTVKQSPSGSGPLRLLVPTTGASHRLVDGDIHVLVNGAYAFGWRNLKVTDAKNRVLPSKFVVAAGGWGIEVDDTNAEYPVLIDPVASTPSWAVTGDVADGESRFGNGVAHAGDVDNDGFDDVLIGQTRYSSDVATQNREGRVLLFKGSATGLANTASWTYESDAANVQMGSSIHGIGDINKDGFDDVVVAQELFNGSAGSLSGRVLVFLGNATGLDATPAWTREGTAAGERFGSVVQRGGDANCDGNLDLAVSSPFAASNNGRAWVFYGSGTAALFQPTPWTFTGTGNAVNFGTSLAGDGNLNGDTVTVGPDTYSCDDLVVGEPGFDSPGLTNQGRVVVFFGSASGLSTSPNTTFASNNNQATLGVRIAMVKDINGDGYDDVLGGAPGYSSSAALTQEGAVFLALGTLGGLQPPMPPMTGGVAGARLGSAMHRGGDVNNDGFEDFIVGSLSYSNTEAAEGIAVLYQGTSTGAVRTWSYEPNIAGMGLGFAVAGSGDVNGDGFADFVATARDFADPNTGVKIGAAFGFYGRADCGIGGDFYDDGEFNPANACEVCLVNVSRTSWTPGVDGSACSDGDACTTGDACQAGVCTPTGAVTCSDGNICTADSCDPATGACVFDAAANEGDTCPNVSACVSNTCQAGACAQDTITGCFIANVCYADGAANPANPCQVCNAALDQTDWSDATAGTTCDDGLFCTVNDVCDGAGACTGGGARDCSSVAIECFDATACDEANDQCVPSVPSAIGTACGGDLCTTNGMCDGAGACTGTAVDCSSLDSECTVGVCNLANGACVAQNRVNGTGCDDGAACTTGDACNAGVCVGAPVDCSGLNTACSVGACDANTGTCLATPANDGGACDDGDACTENDVCSTGGCAGTAVTCDDGNSCTADSCDSTTGCVFTNEADGTACTDDNLSCTDDVCVAGTCTNTLAQGCLINNACVMDGALDPNAVCRVCDPTVDSGAYSPAAVGTACPLTACSEDGLSVLAGACDAAGTCSPEVSGAIDCAPYRCDAAACLTACTGDSDCQDGFVCTDSQCAVPMGEDMGPDTGDDVGVPDSGNDAGDDTGVANDMGSDTGADAGADVGTAATELKGSGCACNAAEGSPADMSWMLVGLGLVVMNRRRR